MTELHQAVRQHLERYLAAAPDVPAALPSTVEEFREDCSELSAVEAYLRRAESEFLAQLRDEAEPNGVRLMGVADPSLDIVMTGAYGEPVERIAAITREAKAGLREGQELVSVIRMGFYGRPELGTPILTEGQTIDAVQAVANAGADAVGFYNYAEAPKRCVDWIKPALQALGINTDERNNM